MNQKLIRLNQVLEKTGLSKSTVNRLEACGTFPKKRKIGLRIVVWLESDIDSWIEQYAIRTNKIEAKND